VVETISKDQTLVKETLGQVGIRRYWVVMAPKIVEKDNFGVGGFGWSSKNLGMFCLVSFSSGTTDQAKNSKSYD